jgi:hypothetical protein
MIKDDAVLFSGVSAFLLSALLKQIRMLYKPQPTGVPPKNLFDALFVYLDLAFHAFQMDIRVATSFKITAIVLEVTKNLSKLPLSEQAKLMDKIVSEMRSALESALFQGSSVECLNLLIAHALFSDKFPLHPSVIEGCIMKLRQQHDDEYSDRNKQRLTYFEIVSLVYYLRDNPTYHNLKTSVLADAKLAISEFDPCEYGETAHLLLDLASCPFLKDAEKDELIMAAMLHENKNVMATDIGHFRNFVSNHSWYFNWTPSTPKPINALPGNDENEPNPNYDLERHQMLHTHLLKKQLLLVY